MEKQHSPELINELQIAFDKGIVYSFTESIDSIVFLIDWMTPLEVRAILEKHLTTKYSNYRLDKSFVCEQDIPKKVPIFLCYTMYL